MRGHERERGEEEPIKGQSVRKIGERGVSDKRG